MSDLISRQDAIKQFCNQCKGRNEPCEHRQSCETMKVLKSLPSTEPKTGQWTKVIDEETPNVVKWHYECDQCGAGRFEKGQQYCSRCGARILGEDGEEE